MTTSDPFARPPLTSVQLTDYSDEPGWAIPPAILTGDAVAIRAGYRAAGIYGPAEDRRLIREEAQDR